MCVLRRRTPAIFLRSLAPPGAGCVCLLLPCSKMGSIVQGDDFQHILRLLNTNVDGKNKIMYAMTAIRGIGRRFSNLVCKKAEVDLKKRAGEKGCRCAHACTTKGYCRLAAAATDACALHFLPCCRRVLC